MNEIRHINMKPTKVNLAVSVLVKELKCCLVKCIGLTQKSFKCLKLGKRYRSVLVGVGDSTEKIN